MKRCFALVLDFLLISVAVEMPIPAAAEELQEPDSASAFQILQDYFFYICVHEYFKGQSLDEIDSSIGFTAESLSYDGPTIIAVSDRAKGVAHAMRKRQRPGNQTASGDWRRIGVLANCLEESRKLENPRAK
jgi:hypothetical protein